MFVELTLVDYAESVLGPGTEKILYMPSERALKMLSFGSNIRCIRSLGGVREKI